MASANAIPTVATHANAAATGDLSACPAAVQKLHLGCGRRILPGYVNVDILPGEGVDIIADLRDLPFEDSSVDFIYSCAAIEHFGRREWKSVLAHWYAKLRPGGELRLSTADFAAAAEQYLQAGNIEELLGLISGGQKDRYDWHGMVFDFKHLAAGLEEVGFTNIQRYDWRETDLFEMNIDDYSQAYLPHMDKDHGRLMMLNVLAQKKGPRGQGAKGSSDKGDRTHREHSATILPRNTA